MIPIYLLTDYYGRYGSKWLSNPYRSGYDRRLLAECFARHNFAAQYVPCAEVFTGPKQWSGKIVLYTSSEEIGNNYKTYIEDIVDGLAEAGACLLPRAPLLAPIRTRSSWKYSAINGSAKS